MMIFTLGPHIYCVTGGKNQNCGTSCDECRYMKAHMRFAAEEKKTRKEPENANQNT